VKIYTKRGDHGETDLFAGGRVPKDALRVEAYGEVDELNAALGVAAAASTQTDVFELLRRIQGSLFQLGARLATASPDRGRSASGIGDRDVEALEEAIDRCETELEPLRSFVLPGGGPAAALLHAARTVCRRAERRVVQLAREAIVDDVLLRYLNRLSDLLFVLARLENRRSGVTEIPWHGRDA
jgi:cob(I)alamin adenosyltransferase